MEFKVNIPEGYCIDVENSTFECIRFKPKKLTYDDVADKLFGDGNFYYINDRGEIEENWSSDFNEDLNNATTEKQLKKILAINMLLNVAEYLNDGWKPNWQDGNEEKWYIRVVENELRFGMEALSCGGCAAYFKTKELAKKAIDILNEDVIKIALL